MLYKSPTSGQKVGMTFLQPKCIEDLIARREAITEWAMNIRGDDGPFAGLFKCQSDGDGRGQ